MHTCSSKPTDAKNSPVGENVTPITGPYPDGQDNKRKEQSIIKTL